MHLFPSKHKRVSGNFIPSKKSQFIPYYKILNLYRTFCLQNAIYLFTQLQCCPLPTNTLLQVFYELSTMHFIELSSADKLVDIKICYNPVAFICGNHHIQSKIHVLQKKKFRVIKLNEHIVGPPGPIFLSANLGLSVQTYCLASLIYEPP